MQVKNLHLVTLLAFILLLLHYPAKAQTVEFFDDFESGASNWTLTNNWGLSSIYSNSGANSLTESPAGNYTDSETSYATMVNAVDLSVVLDANLSFWAIYDIEGGFDYMYVDVSGDGGSNWVNIASFDGENNLTPWIQYTYSLGGFVGSANVLVRFRFVSDGAVIGDGMYIDDFEITSNNIDNSPPLILHTPPVLYEASLSDQNLIAEIIDVSGLSVAELLYTVDGGAPQTISGVNITGDDYLFVVPQQLAGSWVDYWITATDASDSLNSIQSDTSGYISGNYIVYDNAQVDFVNSYGPLSPFGYPGAAVRITLPGTTDLVTCLIRNYTDINRPNDSMMIHVWNDGGGIPGADLITPFMVFPEATLTEPNRITRVDLRPYAAQLSNLSGDVFVGFTVPAGEVWLSQTTPGIATRTFADTVGVWINITDDYHFRAITDTFAGAPVADFSHDTINDPLIVFADSSTNSPTSWFWDFGDLGATSNVQNPSYTFSANGTYNVCLTATNGIGSDTKCRLVTIGNLPTADFTAINMAFCQENCIDFTDLSTNSTSWFWLFSGGTPPTDTTQNPANICYNSPGSYDVTLIVTNAVGTDALTLISFITVYPLPPMPIITASGSTTFCQGDSVTFTSSSATGNQWYRNAVVISIGGTNQTYVPTLPGVYTVTVTDSNGCSATSAATVVTVNPVPPKPTINPTGNDLSSSSATGNQWYLDTMILSGDTSQIFTITQSGNYTVVVTDSNGCSSTSDVFSAVFTGIDEQSTVTSITIIPNPNNGTFELVFESSINDDYIIELTNVIGQVIYKENLSGISSSWKAAGSAKYTMQFDLTNYGKGIYLLSLKNSKQQIIKKVVVY